MFFGGFDQNYPLVCETRKGQREVAMKLVSIAECWGG
jgi:hypothetical protein